MSSFYRIIKDRQQTISMILISFLISLGLVLYVSQMSKEELIEIKKNNIRTIDNLKKDWDYVWNTMKKGWNNFTPYDETKYKGPSYYYQEKCIEECTIIYQIQIDEEKEFYNRWNHPEGFPKIGNTNVDIRIEKTSWSRLIILYDTSGNIKEKTQCRETCKMEKHEYKPFNFYDLHDKNE